MPVTQENRLVAVATDLDEDVLVLRRMSGTERLGHLFEFELDLASEDMDIAYDKVLGTNMTVRVALEDGSTRYFNGFVSSFTQVGYEGLYATYRAILRPWFWFLTRTSDCRIFQEKSVPDIVKEVFGDHGFTSFVEDKLDGTYEAWKYCVQYRETDFNFICRLLEQEGIYFYFTHEDGEHHIVLSDSVNSHEPYPYYEKVPYYPPDDHEQRDRDHVNDLSVSREVQPGSFVYNDFDFMAPKKSLLKPASIGRDHPASEFEMYDYPGEYWDPARGERLAKVRIEEFHTQFETVSGGGNARGLAVGNLFELEKYPREDLNKEYLIVAASYEINSDPLQTIGSAQAESEYRVQFSAIDKAQQYRPPRITHKPIISGLQSGIVVGKAGEEIYTDQYGRVKVQFHWDRYGGADEKSSCWIRVAQVWAGKSWGAMYIPRIGHEVLVDFIEGDPDRPMIVGRLYNDTNKPPYELPANATISTLKSNSSKGGQGFNELRFEDKKGEEQLYIHAEKNKDIRIKNDLFEWVGHDAHQVIKNDKFEIVENNRSEEIKADHIEKIGKDFHREVVGKQSIKIGEQLSLSVDGDVSEVFKKNHSEETTDDYYLKATNICIEATDNVTIKVGDSFIAIESSGIKIGTTGDIVLDAGGNVESTSGADTTLSSGTNFDIDAGANLTAKATGPAEVSTSAILTLKGSLVKIN